MQYLILSLFVVIVFVPVVMTVMGGLKTRGEFMTRPYTIPIPPNWENYTRILGQPSFWLMLRNSLIVMLATTGGVVFVCSLAAFVFSRMEFRGKGLAFNFFTLGLMFPITIAILPVYLALRQMELTDRLLGVILVQITFQISGNILILRGFFAAIPAELQDAAYIDGCTASGFFWRILLPLARPALAAVAALTMIVSWNDLLVPLVRLRSRHDARQRDLSRSPRAARYSRRSASRARSCPARATPTTASPCCWTMGQPLQETFRSPRWWATRKRW